MQDSEGKIRVAVVGLGHFARPLTEAAVATQRLDVVSCFTRTPGKAQAFARRFGCKAAVSFDAILDDPRIEGVILTTPNGIHCEQTVALAQAGKHVFVEKPLCNTLEEADRMIAAQASREARLALADDVVVNDGHPDHLQAANNKI